jgi:hypothetical protein
MRMLSAFVAAVAIAALSASSSFAADERDVTLVNQTGYAIKFVGFNLAGDNDWSENEISHDLGNGQRVDVKFSSADKGCNWNLKVDWTDYAESVLWRNINLCTVNVLTLRYDRAANQTSFTAQ